MKLVPSPPVLQASRPEGCQLIIRAEVGNNAGCYACHWYDRSELVTETAPKNMKRYHYSKVEYWRFHVLFRSMFSGFGGKTSDFTCLSMNYVVWLLKGESCSINLHSPAELKRIQTGDT
jgi:hypothetical protein